MTFRRGVPFPPDHPFRQQRERCVLPMTVVVMYPRSEEGNRLVLQLCLGYYPTA